MAVLISRKDTWSISKSIVETIFECIANGELSVGVSNPAILPAIKEEWVDIVREGIDWWIDSEEEVKDTVIDWKMLYSEYKEYYMTGTPVISWTAYVGVYRWIEKKIKEQQK